MILSYLGRVRQGAELCISKPPPVFPAGAAVSLLVEDVGGGALPGKVYKDHRIDDVCHHDEDMHHVLKRNYGLTFDMECLRSDELVQGFRKSNRTSSP